MGLTEADQEEFRLRLQNYVERFPESDVLKAVPGPDPDDPSEFLKRLEKLSGFDEEQKRWIEKTVREVRQQSVPIPFAWRPRQLLVNVSDVIHLWEIAKHSNKDAREYHLMMYAESPSEEPDLTRLSAPPLLDILSLSILFDLKLVETLFAVFKRIAVAKITLLELQNLRSPVGGSLCGSQASQILDALKRRLNRIVQPGTPNDRHWRRSQRTSEDTDHLKGLVQTGSFVGYSDDVYVRVYYDVPASLQRPVCTFDLLRTAERRGLLTTPAVAERVAKLAAWNVIGVPVSMKHFLSVCRLRLIPRMIQ